MQQSDKIKVIQSLNEDKFREDVLIPLLKKMGMTQVRERHGTQEFGKDITFCMPNAFGVDYYAVVAKVGKIDGSSTGKQNLNSVINQVDMAFQMKFDDIENHKQHAIQHVIVWTSGHIATNAEKRIMESSRDFRNIKFYDGQKTIELLEQHYPSFFTIRDPYISEYYTVVKETYARIEELRALGGSSESHRLPVIFVPPTMVPFSGRRVRPAKNQTGSESVKFTFDDILDSKEDIVVLGEAGAGKSTLLRRILLSIIESNEYAARKSPIPVFVSMKKVDLENEKPIDKAVYGEFIRFSSFEKNENEVLNLDDGSVIVLLDGIDELKQKDKISKAIDIIKEFKSRHKKTRMIITSRLIDNIVVIESLSGFKKIEIRALTPAQMVRFVHNWYGKDSQVGSKLIQTLESPMSFHGLPMTPLTLTLVVSLFENGTKELPANLTELFQKYTELALNRWDTTRDIALQFEWRIKEFILRKIGWHLHKTNSLSVSVHSFHDMVSDINQNRGLFVDVDEFCKELVERSELIIVNEDGEYEFKHRSFKDFFAGIELDDQPDAVKMAVDNALDPWWSQTIFFASGLRPSSDTYVRAIVNGVTPSGVENLTSVINTGLLIQAAYLISRESKKEAVLFVIDRLIKSWNPLCDMIQRWKESSRMSDFRLKHIDLVAVFGVFSQMSLGSITLKRILSEIAGDIYNEIIDNSDNIGRMEQEWKAYIVAMSCLKSGDAPGFVKLFEVNIITDPSFLMIGLKEIEDALERSWFSENDKRILRNVSDRIEKRLGRLKEYRYYALTGEPVPMLPENTVSLADKAPVDEEAVDNEVANEDSDTDME